MTMRSVAAKARLTCLELLRQDRERLAHSAGVARTVDRSALRLAPGDSDVLVAAAWMHDLGYSTELRRTGLHALDGAVHAQRAGLPPVVVPLIAYHSQAELEARRLGLEGELRRFPPPPRALMDIVDHADATVSRRRRRLPTAAATRFGEAVHRHQGHPARYDALLRALPARRAAVTSVEHLLAATPG